MFKRITFWYLIININSKLIIFQIRKQIIQHESAQPQQVSPPHQHESSQPQQIPPRKNRNIYLLYNNRNWISLHMSRILHIIRKSSSSALGCAELPLRLLSHPFPVRTSRNISSSPYLGSLYLCLSSSRDSGHYIIEPTAMVFSFPLVLIEKTLKNISEKQKKMEKTKQNF